MHRSAFAWLSLLALCGADAAAETLVPTAASLQLNGDAQLGSQAMDRPNYPFAP